jgi:hypothetical protein
MAQALASRFELLLDIRTELHCHPILFVAPLPVVLNSIISPLLGDARAIVFH